jgi:hypothetical protein
MFLSKELLLNLIIVLLWFKLKIIKCETQEKYISAVVYTKWSETPLVQEAR